MTTTRRPPWQDDAAPAAAEQTTGRPVDHARVQPPQEAAAATPAAGACAGVRRPSDALVRPLSAEVAEVYDTAARRVTEHGPEAATSAIRHALEYSRAATLASVLSEVLVALVEEQGSHAMTLSHFEDYIGLVREERLLHDLSLRAATGRAESAEALMVDVDALRAGTPIRGLPAAVIYAHWLHTAADTARPYAMTMLEAELSTLEDSRLRKIAGMAQELTDYAAQELERRADQAAASDDQAAASDDQIGHKEADRA
jgi:hypothetical protein